MRGVPIYHKSFIINHLSLPAHTHIFATKYKFSHSIFQGIGCKTLQVKKFAQFKPMHLAVDVRSKVNLVSATRFSSFKVRQIHLLS